MRIHLTTDPRIDPRIRAMFGPYQSFTSPRNVESRDALFAEEYSEEGKATQKAIKQLMDSMDDESIAPSAGLTCWTETIQSQPDGNNINLLVTRPDGAETLPCVYYIHGGGMATGSCYDGGYRAFARLMAAQGVAVIMPDFRNAVHPSSVPEIAPFPAGLQDCMSGLDWVRANAAKLNIDSSAVIISGESGGGNLAIALTLKLCQENRTEIVKGLYALCPLIAGEWPLDRNPSSTDYNGVLIETHTNRRQTYYGIEAWRARDPLAWPGFAAVEDVAGFPPTIISVNEFDPLRDEGIGFFRLLLEAGVRARCRTIMGTVHAIEIFVKCCPEISRDAARHIAQFALDA